MLSVDSKYKKVSIGGEGEYGASGSLERDGAGVPISRVSPLAGGNCFSTPLSSILIIIE
jgi:hypothetical protein